MAGRPGLFGGSRQSDAPERDAEFGFGPDSQNGPQFARLGDSRSTRDGGFGTTPGFDPVWGTLGPPATQAVDPWKTQADGPEADGPIIDVDIFGSGFQISGQICTGQFPRLSDWLNMQQGFIRVQKASLAHLGNGNLPDPDRENGTLWVRLDQIVVAAERAVMATARPGPMVIEKEKRNVTIVTPGYSLRGSLHVHAYGSMKQFLESPDPHFIPVTDVLIRWTSDPKLVSRFPFAMINRQQLISVLDEPATPAGEGSDGDSSGAHDADLPLHRRSGAA